MDKQGIIGIVCLLIFAMIWMQISPSLRTQPNIENKAVNTENDKVTILNSNKKKSNTTNTTYKSEKNTKKVTKINDLKPVFFGNKQFELTIDPEKGVLTSTFSNFKDENKKDDFSFLDKNNASLFLYDPKKKWTYGQATIEHNGSRGQLATYVKVSRPILNEDFILEQEWVLKENTLYQYDYNVTFISIQKNKELNGIRLNCGFVAPMTGANSYMSFADQSADIAIKDEDSLDVVTNIFSSFKDDLINLDKNQGFKLGTSRQRLDSENVIKWVAVKNQYFANIVDSKEGFINSYIGYANMESENDDNKLITLESSLPNFSFDEENKKTFSFHCYTGPQKLDILEKLGDDKQAILQFSLFFKWKFAWLGFIAELLLKALNFFYNIFGNYGLSIIALTVSIKAAFWRLTDKSTQSMKKMQQLAPQMKELKEKYKGNPQMMQQKTMELYRTNGVNPISGCLPILLQMPIYIALFSMIRSTIELRHQSFLWATDLAQPDTLFSIGIFDFRLLILIWVALMIYQQRMMPTSAEAMQRNMMLIMPVIMLVFCYGAPSALTLYFAVQSLVTLIQYKVNNRKEKRKLKKKTV